MSKVAINGRKLPLAPIAGGLAGLIAFAIFMVLPQAVLEAIVWQTRLDQILPMAGPPLGTTARLLTAIAAACIAGGLTVLLSWKVGAAGTSRTRKLTAPETIAEMEAAPVAVPVAEIADADDTADLKPSLLGRLRRKKAEEEIDLDAMPMTRRRDFHPDSAARRPLFADGELPGDSLATIGVTAEPSATDSIGERQAAPIPEWAYEEDCDLSGLRSQPQQSYADEIHPAVAALSDPLSDPLPPSAPVEAPMPEVTQQQAPEARVISAVPESAGTEDWDDLSSFEQYMGLPDSGSLTDEAPSGDDAIFELQSLAPEPVSDATETATPAVAEPAFTPDATGDITPEPASIDAEDYPQAVAPMPVALSNEASVEELIARLEQGLARRAERRARLTILSPASAAQAESVHQSASPFAAIDPLANLADKEAEVDEALRAALSTLERMNRRAAG